ncbi:MAG TPA: glycosyltransferase family 39 protein [Gaiellaceae bacterium]
MRIFAATRHPAVLVGAAAALPRLVALLVERGDILASFTEKSDDFARTFVASGTFGFVPGVPSAYTQPLYGWFLIPLYWIFGRHWLVVGLAQIAVAVVTALVVLEIGRRFVSPRTGLYGALIATLSPYLVWHDVHVNRELLDQLAGATAFGLTLLLAQRANAWIGAALGGSLAVAVLGNARLVLLPLVVAAFVAWRLRARAVLALAVGAVAFAVVLAPWVVRNKVQVGCFAITTDARALWKANNVNTYETLKAGKWIDDVPPLPGAPRITPEFERDFYRNDHRIVRVDECSQMRLYRHATIEFWREHPGEKAKLAAQATGMLWDPRPTKTEAAAAGTTGVARWATAAYFVALFVLAVGGVVAVPGAVAVLAVSFVAYETFAAMVFVGATRYRVAFDFVLALLAGAALQRLASRRR